jgi:hypothetical protein
MRMFIILFCLIALHRYSDGFLSRVFQSIKNHTTELPIDIFVENDVVYTSLFDNFDKLDDTVKSFFLCL